MIFPYEGNGLAVRMDAAPAIRYNDSLFVLHTVNQNRCGINLDFFYGNPGFHKVITHSVTDIGNPALNRENGMSFEINIRNDTVLGNR